MAHLVNPVSRAPGMVRKALAIAVKDLRSEARGKEIAPAMVLFALALVFISTFAVPPGSGRAPAPPPVAGAVAVREVAGVLLWLAVLFAAITGFGRSASAENDGSRMDALALAPVDPMALFAGKVAANLSFLAILQVFLVPVWLLFFGLPPRALFPELLAVIAVADVGLAAVGTLFGAASQYARSRHLIMPLLAFPALLPLVLSAARLTSTLALGGQFGNEIRWFVLLIVFDVVFVTLGAVLFQFVIEE